MDAKEQHERERLRELESEFPPENEWLRHFKRLVSSGKRNAVVEVVYEACPGCHLAVCYSLLQEARNPDKIVKCEHCDRIVFSTQGAIPYRLSSADVQQGRLPLPRQLAIRSAQSVRICDIWGSRHEARVNGNWLTSLGELFAAHAVSAGEQVKLIKAGDSEDVLWFEPEMVSTQEIDQIVTRIRMSDRPLALDLILEEMLEKKARVYRRRLLRFKVRSELEKQEGIYFRGDLVWRKTLVHWPRSFADLPKPGTIPPPPPPPRRAEPRYPPSPPPTETTITLNEKDIEGGVFRLRAAFGQHFGSVNNGEKIALRFGVSEDLVVEFDASAQVLKGAALRQWYQFNGLGAGEKVSLTVWAGEPRVFHIYTEWKRAFNPLLEQARKGTSSYSGPRRDLLYGLLAEANQALHYRDLWSRAAELSVLRIGTVISTLSRYNRRLFCSVGGGRWGLMEWPSEQLQQERERRGESRMTAPPSLAGEESLWKAIRAIEEHDLVYKLLKRAGCDRSYLDIARELAAMLNVNAEHLTETSFLNVRDERLQHLANGSWTLKEFVAPRPPEPPPPLPEFPAAGTREEARTRMPRPRWLWYVLAALMAFAALVWFLVTR